jgi:hypothetical protein
MSSRPCRGVRSLRGRVSARGLVLLAMAFGVQATSGCLSNEYRIQKDELRRLAELPPEARGQGVRVGQRLGERRGDAVESPERYGPQEQLSVQLNLGGGSGDGSSPAGRGGPAPSGGWRPGGGPGDVRGVPGSGVNAGAAGGFRGAPSGGAFHGAPAGGGFHGAPAPSGGGGGGGLSLPSGGGGNGGDVLVVLVLAVIIGAAVATVVLAASEGVLYEGHAEMAPEQVIHIEGPDGGHDVLLAALTREEAAAADSALVMDDEGYGLRRLDHAPLDRKGGVFRFELGGGVFNFGAVRASGLVSHAEAGYFPTSHFGLLFDLGLESGSPDPSCCVGPAVVADDSLTRISLGLEMQALPLALGPLHLGAFAGAGVAIAGPAGVKESGPMGSAGALLELDLTSHMALTVRGAASTARLPSGWSSADTLTGGLAIY